MYINHFYVFRLLIFSLLGKKKTLKLEYNKWIPWGKKVYPMIFEHIKIYLKLCII